MNMRKALALLLATVLLAVNLTSCASPSEERRPLPGSNVSMLDGKKVIFLGSSHTFCSGAVIESSNTVLTQAERDNDQGYFYQICKANGAEVSVTDWCYGGHNLLELFDGSCNANRGHDGFNHLEELKDRWYDYVVIQNFQIAGWQAEDYVAIAQEIMDIFRAANPNVKFLYVVHNGIYVQNFHAAWKDSVTMIEQQLGVPVVDWGTLVWDVIHKGVNVPNAQLEYTKTSFIAADGNHPNLLSGYLYALMVYCAITGETTVGQNYAFCTDDQESWLLDPERFRQYFYKTDDPITLVDERQTNFIEVFESEVDMKGLQMLAEQYLTQESKLNRHYTVIFKNEDGSVIKSSEYCYGDTLIWPPRPTKPADEENIYVFLGWDAPDVCLGDGTYTARFGAKPVKK